MYSETPTHDTSIIFVHGSWGASWMWKTYMDYFSKHGWNVYALDLRGHGESSISINGARMEDYVDDIQIFVTKHSLKNPIVIGHSMGGLVALMYAVSHSVKALVTIDPSPSKEVQGAGVVKTFPSSYSPMDAGMPEDLMEVMKAFPDISKEALMNMKDMLGMESGVARTERKIGISISKESLKELPTLFVGSEMGESVPFGIGIRTARAMSTYYGKDIIETMGATHPGILVGEHATETATLIEKWLAKTKMTS